MQELHFAGGLVDFVNWMVTTEGHKLVLMCCIWAVSGTFTERIPVINGGKTSIEDVERNVDVDHVSLAWTSGYDAHVKSFVNIISTPHGGTHLAGFERGVTKATTSALRATKGIPKYPDEGVTKDDVLEGVTAAVTVRLAEPQFEGQTKEVRHQRRRRDCEHGCHRIVGEVLSPAARKIRPDGCWRRWPRPPVPVSLPGRLRRPAGASLRWSRRPCRQNWLIVAVRMCRAPNCSSWRATRRWVRSNRVGIRIFRLPCRFGKDSEHVAGHREADAGKQRCAAIIQVMGAGSGRSFELPSVRYGRLVILTDADVDGAHIRCLLLTLIYRYMRPLLDAGMVYAAVPPLHQVTVGSGKRAKHHYTYSDEQSRTLLDELRRKKGHLGPGRHPTLQGLGEMDAEATRHNHFGSRPSTPAPHHGGGRRSHHPHVRRDHGLQPRASAATSSSTTLPNWTKPSLPHLTATPAEIYPGGLLRLPGLSADSSRCRETPDARPDTGGRYLL